MNILLFGIPGSGKTTQSKIIAKTLNLKYISVGEITRREVFKDTELGKRIKNYWDKEQFFDKGFLSSILIPYLEQDNFILDGFPKTKVEYEDFLNMQRDGLVIDKVIVLDNSYIDSKKRVDERVNCRFCGQPFSRNSINNKTKCICGERLFFRRDDESIFDIRCNDFENETRDIIGKVSENFPTKFIDSSGSVEEVSSRVLEALEVETLNV